MPGIAGRASEAPLEGPRLPVVSQARRRGTSPAPLLVSGSLRTGRADVAPSQFFLPRVAVTILLRTPEFRKTAEDQLAFKLFIAMLEDSLNELSYQSSVGGLSASFSEHVEGLQLDLEGYSECAGALLKRVCHAAKHFGADDETAFHRILDQQRRRLYNRVNKAQPLGLSQCMSRSGRYHSTRSVRMLKSCSSCRRLVRSYGFCDTQLLQALDNGQ